MTWATRSTPLTPDLPLERAHYHSQAPGIRRRGRWEAEKNSEVVGRHWLAGVGRLRWRSGRFLTGALRARPILVVRDLEVRCGVSMSATLAVLVVGNARHGNGCAALTPAGRTICRPSARNTGVRGRRDSAARENGLVSLAVVSGGPVGVHLGKPARALAENRP